MKKNTICIIACTLLFISCRLNAQALKGPENIIIITIDGFRWQEVFTGADPELLRDSRFVQDKTMIQQLYGDSTPELRRQKLMPFFWNVIEQNTNMDVLVNDVMKGKNHPAQGNCKQCTTADVMAAIKYILKQSDTEGNYILW